MQVFMLSLAALDLCLLLLLIALRLLPRSLHRVWRLRLNYATWAIGALTIPAVFVVLLWLPEMMVWSYHPRPEDKPLELINQYRATLAQIVGGAGLLIGATVAWLQLRTTQAKDLADRYYRAAELLGATSPGGEANVAVRIAAIQSLGRILRESREYHWPILELLCSYVRLQAKTGMEGVEKLEHPRDDVAAALDVIVHRAEDSEEGEFERLDLSWTCLKGAYLAKAGEEGLQGANLQRAYLWFAVLDDADLRNADLSGAQLQGASLRGAMVYGANFEGASLAGECDISGVDLRRSRNLSSLQVAEAKGDETTQLPASVQRPQHWGPTA